jgi:phospholipid/cholesterol/gamma-HCH transport system substrate-binding protein
MRRSALDVAVGVFLLVGILALGWLSVRLGRVELFTSPGYVVFADSPRWAGSRPGRRWRSRGSRSARGPESR